MFALYFLYLVRSYPLNVDMYHLSFLHFAWAAFLGYGNSDLYFLYLARPYPWNVGNVYFTFPLYVIALCMMYVYLYMLLCG